MSKVKHRSAPTARRPTQQAPPPHSGPLERDRLARISGFAEVLLKAARLDGLSRSQPIRILANPQGASLGWTVPQILELKKRADRGQPVLWDVTNLTTRTTETVLWPMLDRRPRKTAAKRPGRPTAFTDEEWRAHIAALPLKLKLSPGRRASALSSALHRPVSKSAVWRRLQKP